MFEAKVSLASYCFHKMLEEKMIDVYGYLESLKYRYQVPNADIWNGYLKGMDTGDFRKIRRAMEERGLGLASLCCDWANVWGGNPDDEGEFDKSAAKCLEAAEILGAKTVRFDVGVKEDDISEEQFEKVCKKFAAYAKRGSDAGFAIGPENHWGASRRLSVQQRLYKEINSKNYGMLLHLGNWNLEEGQTKLSCDLAAASMAVHTHVDYEHAMTISDWLADFIKAGYKGLFGIEHHKEIYEYQGAQAQLGAVLYGLAKLEKEANK
ncbi:MAG: sugar phosphate isomerase/epimerase [Treponema sp.]|jgi:sugar phosphate isomerase/epimerase|nr:sugar phosphate isomerase/epimerase [Treponema sp.]